jgi:hypothetical protein
LITVLETKPVPVTTIELAADPAGKLDGTSCVVVGEGLSTSRSTFAPEPLVDEPFRAMIGSRAPVASCAAGMAAVTVCCSRTQ